MNDKISPRKTVRIERPTNRINRRRFLYTSALAAGALAANAPVALGRVNYKSSNEKLAVACIGLGNQMHSDLRELVNFHQEIVAICDVDTRQIERMRKDFASTAGKANVYTDFRRLLEREKSIDAVAIATPDHWHAAVCMAAIEAGKHVYCEKPLTHTIGDARRLEMLAKKSKVATQTGNQGSGSSNFRRSIELIQAGVFGPIREIHIWHPHHDWPNGVPRPEGADPIPHSLDWNFWVGPSPLRPYKDGIYHPVQWRGWYDFGGGSLADFTCHAFSMPTRALNLDYPTHVAVTGDWLGHESFPTSCRIDFSFPARGNRAPVTIHFHTGGEMPGSEVTAGISETFNGIPRTGCLLLGDKGTLSAGLWNNECYVKMKGDSDYQPADNHDAAKNVPRTLPRAPQDRHMLEWINACKGMGKTFSPFEFGGHVTEIGASGLVALRLGRNIEWDGAAMKVKDDPAAERFINPPPRQGWTL